MVVSKKKRLMEVHDTVGQDCWIEQQSNHSAHCLNEARVRPLNEARVRPLNEARVRPLNEARVRPLNEARVRPLNEARVRPLNEARVRPHWRFSIYISICEAPP